MIVIALGVALFAFGCGSINKAFIEPLLVSGERTVVTIDISTPAYAAGEAYAVINVPEGWLVDTAAAYYISIEHGVKVKHDLWSSVVTLECDATNDHPERPEFRFRNADSLTSGDIKVYIPVVVGEQTGEHHIEYGIGPEQGACGGPSHIHYTLETFVQDSEASISNVEIEVSTYPNPATSQMTISIPSKEDTNATLVLYNYAGQTLYSSSTEAKSSIISFEIFKEEVAQWGGVLYYQISTSHDHFTGSILTY